MHSRAVLVFAVCVYSGKNANVLHVADIYATHYRIFGPVLSPDWGQLPLTANESGQIKKCSDAWSSSKNEAKIKYNVDYDRSHRQV